MLLREKRGISRWKQPLLAPKLSPTSSKVLIDTLSSAVTADSLEKMEEASKTVFNRVEDLVGRSDENHSDDKAEHQTTRDRLRRPSGSSRECKATSLNINLRYWKLSRSNT